MDTPQKGWIAMEEFEKVEKLKQSANVSYEDAREALRACDGDLLDAIVYLEKQGKVEKPEQQMYSTKYDEQPQYENVQETVEKQAKQSAEDSFFRKLGRFLKKILKKSDEYYLHVEHYDKTIIKLPLWAVAIIFLFAWHLTLIVMIISLFCGCRYHIEGEGNLEAVNHAMGKASDAAEYVKDEFEKS